jgi:exodeoxyribonuclease V alpha subunit
MMVGDVDQIPSIGPGRILGELIESKVIPTTILTKVHRQAQGSLIITNANRVKHGRMLTTSHEIGANSGIALRDDFFLTTANDENKVVNMLKEAYQKRIPGLIKRDGTPINPARDVLLICPQKTGTLGVRNINKVLQELLNPNLTGAHTLSIKRGGKDFEIRLKDRVIVTKNLNQRYLVNGDIGTVTSISASSFVARFDGGREFEFKPDNFGNVDLGYSITVHKSQGSQAPMVIALFHSAAPMMRQRNLFYTAITRPEDYLWVIGKPHIIKSCIENDTPRDRLTRLKSLLTAPDRT